MSKKFMTDLDLAIRARFSGIVVKTIEEGAAVETITSVAVALGHMAVSWDLASGFQKLTDGALDLGNAPDPSVALQKIIELPAKTGNGGVVVVLKDFHEFWTTIKPKRLLRNTIQRLRSTLNTLVITSPTGDIPTELKDELIMIELDMPTAAELDQILVRVSENPRIKTSLTEADRLAIVNAAGGLTREQGKRAFIRAATVGTGMIDAESVAVVTAQKEEIIRGSSALSFVDTDGIEPDHLAGLGVLKDWLKLRLRAFSPEARVYGLPSPKGVALTGIQGTGKSLAAKVISRMLNVPLVSFDVGAVFGGVVGQTEENTRQVFKQAEALGRIVLWIDEIDKVIGPGGSGDGGVTSRFFGSLLTWMQEKKAPIFVIVTANDTSRIPPEFLRRGRFDEVFFLDLPTLAERREILSVHIAKRGRDAAKYDLDLLAEESKARVGAELEQAIIEAMYLGFDEGTDFQTRHVSAAIKKQIPLAVARKDDVDRLRSTVRNGQAISASYAETESDGMYKFDQVNNYDIQV